MLFRLFTLHPDIFSSFVSNSLIARGVAKKVIEFDLVNWRDDFGIGNYKQVDDKPFGGGSGMVLMPEPIIQALNSKNCLDHSEYITKNSAQDLDLQAPTKDQILPNNSNFFEAIASGQLQTKKVNILTSPRGFPLTQQVSEWLAENFEEINILCGRYEGFDSRVADEIDLELSLGNFVLNGGEVAAMCMVESVARLIPDFITKNTSVLHDSFSSELNKYSEFAFGNGSLKYQDQFKLDSQKSSKVGFKSQTSVNDSKNLFDDNWWLNEILPKIEHPQYTRPEIWNTKKVPEVLLSGHHSNIQKWRQKWYL